MLAPALDYSAPPERWQHLEYFLAQDTDTTRALISAAGDHENFLGASDLPCSQPYFRPGASLSRGRKHVPEIQRSLGAEGSVIHRLP